MAGMGRLFRWLLEGGAKQASGGETVVSAAAGDLYLAPASQTRTRVEAAMPGTSEIEPALLLEPPPVSATAANIATPDKDRDYAPDPIADFSLVVPATSPFRTRTLGEALTSEVRERMGLPMFRVRTPAGRVIYMASADASEEAVEVILAWTLSEVGIEDKILPAAREAARWLAARPEGFAIVEPDEADLRRKAATARRILAVAPDQVSILAWREELDGPMDGRKVWQMLHALGIRWGDMDQFQWPDPTGQTDYLFWAQVDDGAIGYALPEEIAAGRQHFRSVHFTMEVPRSPAPRHVLGQMQRAVERFAPRMGVQLTAMIDGQSADGVEALFAAVDSAVAELRAIGVEPGSSSVCRLR